jgi:hypothetical protein
MIKTQKYVPNLADKRFRKRIKMARKLDQKQTLDFEELLMSEIIQPETPR